jgi:hypothetical protein
VISANQRDFVERFRGGRHRRRMRRTTSITLVLLLAACDGPADTDRDGSSSEREDASRPRTDGGREDPRDGGDDPRPDAWRPDPPAECALPAPIDQDVVYERTLHVAPGGNDGNDGSEGSPFATIDAAIDEASPGTRVLVHAGSYGPFSIDNVHGEPGRPIAIEGEGEVVIEARGEPAIIRGSDPSYVVLEGLRLEGAETHGMNIDDGGSYDSPAHHVVLRALVIPSAGTGDNHDCIKLSGVDDFWVLDSDVADCDRGEIIDMVGSHRGVIANNYFHDTVQSGVQTKGGSSDTIIAGNLFEDIPSRAVMAGGSTGLPYIRPLDATAEGARIRIIGNVFVRVGAEGGAPVAFVGCDACVAAHNTIIEPRTWIVRILQENMDARFVPSRDGLFVNNVIVMNQSEMRAQLVNIGGGTAPETFVFGSNLWQALDEGGDWRPDLGDVPDESDSIYQQDPSMIDREGGNYAIGADSPARGMGRDVGALPPDFSGACFADPPSLGAFEVR